MARQRVASVPPWPTWKRERALARSCVIHRGRHHILAQTGLAVSVGPFVIRQRHKPVRGSHAWGVCTGGRCNPLQTAASRAKLFVITF
jgi:hypothetical protein